MHWTDLQAVQDIDRACTNCLVPNSGERLSIRSETASNGKNLRSIRQGRSAFSAG
jgi:hypothetical protein